MANIPIIMPWWATVARWKRESQAYRLQRMPPDLREAFVYPGHPTVVALEVLWEYDGRIEEAFAPSGYGWPAAQGNNNIRGAGGEVGRGIALIHHVISGTMTPEEAVRWGETGWHRGKAGGHKKAVKPGQDASNRVRDQLIAKLWKLAPREKRMSRYAILGT